jgi:hypothetical protein
MTIRTGSIGFIVLSLFLCAVIGKTWPQMQHDRAAYMEAIE